MGVAPRPGSPTRGGPGARKAVMAGTGLVAAAVVVVAAGLLAGGRGLPAAPAQESAEAAQLDAGVRRLAGPDRIATAVAIARDAYPEGGSAEAVVLARADVFADALAGTPLAIDRDAPMLITHSDALAEPVADEIERALGEDRTKTVYLLGGPAALSAGVAEGVGELGYDVERLSGGTRVETAVAVAEALDAAESVLLTTGTAFPDALAAGPAAATVDGAVLLTAGEESAAATDAHLEAHPQAQRFAVGGPAAQAHPDAEAIAGATRADTAVAVAERFFDAPAAVGLARSGDFADALTGGAHAGALTATDGEGAPMLLTATTRLAAPVARYLCPSESTSDVVVYGGTAAVAERIAGAVGTILDGRGCAGDPPSPVLTDASVLHPRGVGLAQAGVSLHDVEHTTATALQVGGFDTFGGFCYHADPQGVASYGLMVFAPGDSPPADPHDGVVARATTGFRDTTIATAAGVRPGDTRSDVEAAYGAENLTESEHAYQPDAVYLDYHTADGRHGLRFEISGDDVVEVIHGGDAEAITNVEGCA